VDFTSIFNSIVELMKDRRSDKPTDWGRWLGRRLSSTSCFCGRAPASRRVSFFH